MVSPIVKEIVLAFGKKCQKCGCENHLKSVCRSGSNTEKYEHSRHGSKKPSIGKRFHEISKEKSESMDDLADQVQSLFYNDVHFNSVNTRMHTEIEYKTPGGKVLRETIQVLRWKGITEKLLKLTQRQMEI